MLKRIIIADHHCAALFKDGEFQALLSAGIHHFWDPAQQLSLYSWPIDRATRQSARQTSSTTLFHVTFHA